MTIDDFIKKLDVDAFYEKSPDDRLQFAQEYENIMAKLEHRDPCKVDIMDKEMASARPGLRGQHRGNTIYLRPDFFYSKKPKILGITKHGFANMIATITHEGRHAWQYYVINHSEKNLVDKKTRLAFQMNCNGGYRNTTGARNYDDRLRRFAEYKGQLIEIDARHFTMDWIKYLADRAVEFNGKAYAELRVMFDKLFQEEQVAAMNIIENFDAAEMQKFEETLKRKLFPGIDTQGVSMFADAFRLIESKNTFEFIECRPVDTSLDIMIDNMDDLHIDLKPDIDRYKSDPFRVSKLKIKKNI